jgi:hypothetical protein
MTNATVIILAIIAGFIILTCIIVAGTSKSRKKKKKAPPAAAMPAANKANKKNKAPASAAPEPSGPTEVNAATTIKKIDYSPIVDMTRIITDNDAPTIEKMRLLSRNYPGFVAEHQNWCNSVAKRAGSNDKHILIMNFFAYWLSGYSVGGGIDKNPTGKFGCQITGTEAPKNIIKMFEEIDRTLNYGLDIGSVNIAGIETAPKLISAVSENLSHKRYTLLSFETGGSGFYLFIVPAKDYDKVIQNSAKVDFKMYRQIMV